MTDTAETGTDPGIITHRVPDWLPVPGVDGLVAVVRPTGRPCWSDLVLAVGHRHRVVWTATGAATGRQVLDLATRHAVRAATLAEAGAATPWVALALDTATRLRIQRSRSLGLEAPCLTTTTPGTGAGLTPVPHLVTVRRHDRTADLAVWELLPPEHVPTCLGVPASNLDAWAGQVPALLWLRTAVREHRMPDTPGAAEVLRLLAGRPVTLPVVLQQPDRFQALLRDAAPPTGQEATTLATPTRTTIVVRPDPAPSPVTGHGELAPPHPLPPAGLIPTDGRTDHSTRVPA